MPAEGGPSDLDEVRAFSKRVGGTCSIQALVDASDPITEKLTKALASDIDSKTIARWLRSKGKQVGYETVKRHRRGECCRGR